jgi:heme exporter protein CcmD
MDWTAHNSGYVIASYALSALALAIIVVVILLRDQRTNKETEKRKD